MAIRSVVGNVIDKRDVAGLTRKAPMRAVVLSSAAEAALDALLTNDDLLAPIATFIPK